MIACFHLIKNFLWLFCAFFLKIDNFLKQLTHSHLNYIAQTATTWIWARFLNFKWVIWAKRNIKLFGVPLSESSLTFFILNLLSNNGHIFSIRRLFPHYFQISNSILVRGLSFYWLQSAKEMRLLQFNFSISKLFQKLLVLSVALLSQLLI